MKKEVIIEGMKCAKCTARVEDALNDIGCLDVNVEIGRAVCEFNDISDKQIKDEIESLGFDVSEINY